MTVMVQGRGLVIWPLKFFLLVFLNLCLTAKCM